MTPITLLGAPALGVPPLQANLLGIQYTGGRNTRVLAPALSWKPLSGLALLDIESFSGLDLPANTALQCMTRIPPTPLILLQEPTLCFCDFIALADAQASASATSPTRTAPTSGCAPLDADHLDSASQTTVYATALHVGYAPLFAVALRQRLFTTPQMCMTASALVVYI